MPRVISGACGIVDTRYGVGQRYNRPADGRVLYVVESPGEMYSLTGGHECGYCFFRAAIDIFFKEIGNRHVKNTRNGL